MADIQIDLTKVQAEISSMSPEQIREKLTKIRVRDKVQQKRNYNSETAKKYQMKAREEKRLLKQKAIELGLWDAINEEAESKAEEKLAEEALTGEEE